MLFDNPIDFDEAIASQAAKTILPTSLSSADMAKLKAADKRAALWSARTENAEYIGELDKALGTILEPKLAADGAFTGLDIAYAREHLGKTLDMLGYKAPTDKENTIEDLSSFQRRQLVLETQLGMATGYGNTLEGQTPLALELFPGKELIRVEERKEPRPWKEERWEQACIDAGDDVALRIFRETDRMVALKDSDVWIHLGPFGNPYPPFDYNSGMGERELDDAECVELGLKSPGEKVEPMDLPALDKGMGTKMEISRDLKESLLSGLGPGYGFDEDGVLTAANEGENCGTGAGGFQPGNTCGKGDGHGTVSEKVKYISQSFAEAKSVNDLDTIWNGNFGAIKAAAPEEKSAIKSAYDAAKGVFEKKASTAKANNEIHELPGKWTKIGSQLGSNPGGIYSSGGDQYYVKEQKSEEHARNERLAADLYKVAGAGVPDVRIGKLDGKIVTTSKWENTTNTFNPNSASAVAKARDDFGVHAWLGNWDAIGLENDNQIFTKSGLKTVDVGGSMMFRAQGEPKLFSANAVDELKTLRDPKVNPQAAKVFAGMSEQEMASALHKVTEVTDAQIDEAVDKNWPQAPAMKGILKARRDIIKGEYQKILDGGDHEPNFGIPEPSPAPAATAQKPVSNAPEVPEPPKTPISSSSSSGIKAGEIPKIAAGWGSKAPSKQAAAALAKIQKIHDTASKGDVPGLESIKTNPSPTAKTYDKKAHAYKQELLTLLKGGGEVQIGATELNIESLKPKMVLPFSEKLKKLKAEVAAEENKITLSPKDIPQEPNFVSKNAAQVAENKKAIVEMKNAALEGDLAAINKITSQSPKVQQYKQTILAAIDAKKPVAPPVNLEAFHGSVETLSSQNPAITHSAATAKLGRTYILSKTPVAIDIPDGKKITEEKIKGLHYSVASQLDGALYEYTGSAYQAMNSSIASGKPSAKAKEAVGQIQKLKRDIPEGTLLSRGFHADTTLVKQYEQAVGHVIQDPAIISTSIKDGWSGNVKWRITTTKGVKGLYVGSHSASSNEHEMILPNDTRFYVKAVKKSGYGTIEVHLVALPGN